MVPHKTLPIFSLAAISILNRNEIENDFLGLKKKEKDTRKDYAVHSLFRKYQTSSACAAWLK